MFCECCGVTLDETDKDNINFINGITICESCIIERDNRDDDLDWWLDSYDDDYYNDCYDEEDDE